MSKGSRISVTVADLIPVVDDCWMMKDGRDRNGHLVPNATRFPDGINGLADKIHDMGLKFGVYSSKSVVSTDGVADEKGAGNTTCADHPASLGFEETDASDFASWGVDCESNFRSD